MRKSKKRFLAMLLAVGMILPNTSFVRAEDEIGPTESTEVVTEVSTESGTEIPSDNVEVVLLDNEGNVIEKGDVLPSSTEDSLPPDTTEVVADDATEPDTDEVTEEVTEEKTDSEESTTENDSEEVTTEADSEETVTEDGKQPTFAQPVAGVDLSGLDFSSKELLIGTDNENVFTWDTTVVSGYEGMYLTRYASVEETKNAYSYYYNKVGYVSPNIVFTVQDNENADDSADLSQMNQGNDAIANLNDMNSVSTPNKTIAVIDTGINANDLVGAVSVLGGTVKDDHGHGTRMYEYIKEEYPNAKVLSIKAMDARGKAKASDICAAIQYAIESKADVINLSFSAKSTEENSAVENAIEDAIKAGIVVIGAAGNNGIDAKETIPGGVEKATVIGACDAIGVKVSTSNYGDTVDYYVVSDSTSEAAARYSAFFISNNSKNEKVFDSASVDLNLTNEPSDEFSTSQSVPTSPASAVTKTISIGGKSYTIRIPSYIMLPIAFASDAQEKASTRSTGFLGAPDTTSGTWRHIGERNIPATSDDGAHAGYDCGSYLRAYFDGDGEKIVDANLKEAFGYIQMTGGVITAGYHGSKSGEYGTGNKTGWSQFYDAGYRLGTGDYSPSVNCMEPLEKAPAPSHGDQFVLYPVSSYSADRTYANYVVAGDYIYVPYRTGIIDSSVITTQGGIQNFLIGAYIKVPIPKRYYIAVQKKDQDGNQMKAVTFDLSFKDNEAGVTRTYTAKEYGTSKTSDGIWTGWYAHVSSDKKHIAGYSTTYTTYTNNSGTTGKTDTPVPKGTALIYLGDYTKEPSDVTVTENWKKTNFTTGAWANGKAEVYDANDKLIKTVYADGYVSNTSSKTGTVRYYTNTALNNASDFSFTNKEHTYYIAVQKHDDDGNAIKGVTFDLTFKDNDAGKTRTIKVNGAGTTKVDGIYTGFFAKVNSDGTHITGYTTSYKDKDGNTKDVPLGVGLIELGSFANAPSDIKVTENWNTTNRVDTSIYSKGKAYLYNSSGTLLRAVYPNYYSNTSQSKDIEPRMTTNNALANIGSYDFINPRKWFVGIYKKDSKGNAVAADFDIYGTNTANATTGGTKVGSVSTNGSTGYGYLDVTSVYNQKSATVAGKYKYFYAKETATAEGHYIGLETKSLTVHAETLAAADYVEWVNPNDVYLYLKKSSEKPEYTKDNPNYSLKGAEYKVFKTKAEADACAADPTKIGTEIATLTVADETGKTNSVNVSSSMETDEVTGEFLPHTFYIAETKPGKNYLRSTSFSSVTVTKSNDKDNPAVVNVTDEPVNDPFSVQIIKTDALTGSNKLPKGKTLAGAQFRVDFYAVDITTPNITAEKLAKDYADKKQSAYTTTITVTENVATREFFADLNDIFPVGFITLTEVTPPADYTLDGAKAYLLNDKIKNISGNLVFVTSATYNATKDDYDPLTYHPDYPTINLVDPSATAVAFNIEVDNTPVRGDIQLTKVRISDDGPIANVEFEIENNDTHEKHSIFTDANGNATTKDNKDTWFSKGENDEEIAWKAGYGSLPAGTYTVTEKRSEANKDYQLLAPISVTIDSKDVKTVAQADGKLYNVELPRIETTATDKATGTKTLPQVGTPQTIVDEIKYYNLRANSTYYIVGSLMIRHADGTYEPYMKDGKPYTITSDAIKTKTTWTKSEFECNGTYTMEFPDVIPEGHEGEYFVVFQKLYYNQVPASDDAATQYVEYAGTDEKIFPVRHEVIDNADQTVRPGDLHTNETDGITYDHIALAEGMVTTKDRVSYTGLTIGETYTIKGTLHITGYTWKDMNGNEIKTVDADDTLLDATGKPVTAEKTFIATKADGYEELEFTYDASLLNGETVVAFEDLYYKEMKIAFHADLKDEDQGVHYPNIHTTLYRAGTDTWCEDFDENDITKATTVDGSSQELLAEENAEVIDRVKYHNLLANRNYIIRGVLMDKDTNTEFVDADGNKVTVEYPFSTPKVDPVEDTKTPNSSKFICEDGTALDMSADHADYLVDGYAEVSFPKFNAKGMDGKTLVAFEEIFIILDDGTEKLVASHKKIDAAEQTVVFPRIGTKAGVEETATTLVPIDGPVTINDTVHYEKLIPGKTYTLTARPLVKNDVTGTYKDGDPLLDKNGNVVEKVFDFVAPDAEGDVVVPITYEGYLLPVIDIVCYEDMSNYKGLKVAVHNDINDKDQTVETCKISTTVKDNTTSDTDSLASEETVFTDTIYYEKLIPGLNYRIKGTLMLKSSKAPVEVNGTPITATVDFTPDDKVGQVDLTFPAFDAVDLALAGEDIVVYEELYLITVDGKEVYIAEHKDIDDEGQTIHLADIPKTTAEDSETEDHIADVDKDVTIIDHVEYKNLLIGKEYTVSGVLMVKETGEKLLVDGKEVTGKTTFTPTTRNGVVDVEFTFDASALEGQTIVVFEDVYREDIHVATHADINDDDQTVRFPKVKTKSEDAVTKENIGEAGPSTTIIDTVSYWNVIPGKEYTVKGVLMLKETGEKLLVNGKPVTAEKTFTAKEADGTVDLTFTFDASLLTGQTVVVFEDLYYNDVHVGTHSDLYDEEQSEHHPGVKTTAKDKKTDKHIGLAEKTVTIVDTVKYTNLIPGKEYTIKGVLMDKDTGKEFLVDGKKVTAEKTFTAEKANGTEELEFTFDGSALKGKAIVVFEDLFYRKHRVASHAEIGDKDQTVTYPSVHTSVQKNTKQVQAIDNVTVYDDVMYDHLLVGKTYQVEGILMDKQTGEPILINGKQIKAVKTFKAESEAGMISMTFNFDATSLVKIENDRVVEQRDVVVFEYLSLVDGDKNLLVATHEDKNDEDQTFVVTKEPTTGDSTPIKMLTILFILAITGAGVVVFFKKRKFGKKAR